MRAQPSGFHTHFVMGVLGRRMFKRSGVSLTKAIGRRHGGRSTWDWRNRGWTGYQPDAMPYTRERFLGERHFATENRDSAREIPQAGEDDVSMAIEAMDRDRGIRPHASRIYERKS